MLTEGGTRTWAICLACEDRGGKALGGAWRSLVLWILGILGALLLAVLALGYLVR